MTVQRIRVCPGRAQVVPEIQPYRVGAQIGRAVRTSLETALARSVLHSERGIVGMFDYCADFDTRMTLGHVYDFDLKNETIICDVIIQAQCDDARGVSQASS